MWRCQALWAWDGQAQNLPWDFTLTPVHSRARSCSRASGVRETQGGPRHTVVLASPWCSWLRSLPPSPGGSLELQTWARKLPLLEEDLPRPSNRLREGLPGKKENFSDVLSSGA